MQTLQKSYEGLSLVFALNMDRLLYVGAIALSLVAGLFIGTLF
jgi:hypothetical protein